MTKMEVKKQTLPRPMSSGPLRTSSPYTPKPHLPPHMRGVMDLSAAMPLMPLTPLTPPPKGLAVSPSNLASRAKGSLMPKKFLIGSRDKEALLEEILELKRVLYEQDKHIKFQKVQTSTLEIENKKLEKDIEDLEAQGSAEAPRTGGSSRLRAKLQGLKMRINELQSTSDTQLEELGLLRKDLRVSHTKEVEIERDVFANEVGSLQKLVRRLNVSHNRISCQNKEVGRLKEKASLLEATQQRLNSSMQAAQETLERSSHDLKCYRNKARETTLEASRNMKRCKELQEHATFLESLLEKERGDKEYFEKKVFQLTQELRRVDTQLQHAKGYSRVNAFKGMPKKKPEVPSVKSTTPTPTPSSGTATPKKPASSSKPSSPRSKPATPQTRSPPKSSPRSPRNMRPDNDVVDITSRLVNAAQFHFEQSFKHKGE